MRFIFMQDYGEVSDLAFCLSQKGHQVKSHIFDNDWKNIHDGMVDKIDDWYSYLGEGWTFVFDGCEHGRLQDWLRSKGEAVFGGSELADKLENDRQLGQKLFKAAGFRQPESKNFKDICEAMEFVQENDDRRWILKQNGTAPKSINHLGKFDGNRDMLYHLSRLKKSWNESAHGDFDCDLMEVVDGTEVAATAFWNGHDWLRDKEGRVVGFLNWEEKKEATGGLGETTGKMGTTFLGCDERNELFAGILLHPAVESVLSESGFRGVFDINGSLTEDGYVAFEPTCRFGVPTESYVFMEGMVTDPGAVIDALAKGQDIPIEIHDGLGMVICVVAKPDPIEASLPDEETSKGEKLWILEDGEPVDDLSDEQMEHIHLYNFRHEEDEETGEPTYLVATESGHLLTVTGRDGETVTEIRENLIDYIKDNLYIPGMKYRTDIGERVEDFLAMADKKKTGP